jgi:hypothetical protein
MTFGKTTISLRGRIGTTVGKFSTNFEDFITTPHPSRKELIAREVLHEKMLG